MTTDRPRGPGWARWLRIAVHVAAWVPLALNLLAYAQGQFIDPIRTITLRTGRTAILFLILSLACTPVELLTGSRAVLAARKPLGLYAALYAGLHLLIFVGWDYGLQFDLIWPEIRQKRYIQVGLLALLILVPLAITSTRRWTRRLGKNWKRLHRLVYGAGVLAVLHYLLVVKADRRLPLIYGAVLLVLLVLRIPAVRRAIRGRRRTVAET